MNNPLATLVGSEAGRIAWEKCNPATVSVLQRRLYARLCGDSALLSLMAFDPSDLVVYSVAWNPYTPPPILEFLSGHGDLKVRRMVAGNEHTSPAVRIQLLQDSNATVREIAMKRQTHTLQTKPLPGVFPLSPEEIRNIPARKLHKFLGSWGDAFKDLDEIVGQYRIEATKANGAVSCTNPENERGRDR